MGGRASSNLSFKRCMSFRSRPPYRFSSCHVMFFVSVYAVDPPRTPHGQHVTATAATMARKRRVSNGVSPQRSKRLQPLACLGFFSFALPSSPQTSEDSEAGWPSEAFSASAHRLCSAPRGAAWPPPNTRCSSFTFFIARGLKAPWGIGASGLRFQECQPQQRSTSTKRKKIGWCGFHPNNR